RAAYRPRSETCELQGGRARPRRRAARLQRMIALVALLSAAAAPHTFYVRAGALFDGTGDAIRQNIVLQIEGDRIRAVGVPIPATTGGRLGTLHQHHRRSLRPEQLPTDGSCLALPRRA